MNKVLIVTGASRGIGAATARLAGIAGYSVCVNYRQNQAVAEKVPEDIEAAGAEAIGLAREVAEEGIRVNAVRPGFFYAEMHASGGEPERVDRVKEYVPMKCGGEPSEVARAFQWLLSGEASFTTGAFIDVTGGK